MLIELEPEILASKNIDETMDTLHFEVSRIGADKFSERCHCIVKMAKTEKFSVLENFELSKSRKEVFEKEVKESLEKANKYAEENRKHFHN